MKRLLFYIVNFILIFGFAKSYSQIADFTLSKQVCLDENVLISNNSSGASNYQWDLCLEEFVNQPSEFALGNLSNVTRVRSATMAYDTSSNSYVLFGSDDSRNDLNRIILGDSLGTSYLHQKVSFSAGNLSSPYDIAITKNSDGNWFGFIGSGTNGFGISRIEFGSSLLNDNINITNLGTFGEGNVQMRDVKIRKEGPDYYLVGLNLNNNRFIIVNYGNSLLNTPLDTIVTSSISGMTLANGFDLIEFQGDVLAFVVGLTSKNIVRVNFGTTISSDITFENSYGDSDFPSTVNRLSRINLIDNYGRYYAIVNQFDSGDPTLTIDLKNLSNDSIPEDLGHANTQLNDVAGTYYNGNYYYYGINGSNLIRLSYNSDCGSNLSYSKDFEPVLKYNLTGNHVIGLKAIDENQTFSYALDTVTVSASQSPDIDFTIDDSRCSSNENVFISSNVSGDINSYQWIFGEDTLEASAEPDTVYQFSPGTYMVTLLVENGDGCTNWLSKEITIYSPPPVPSFNIIGTQCSGTALSFENTTDETGYGTALSYYWDFNGEGSSSQVDTVFTFSESGSKTIKLSSSLPGCSDTTTMLINLNTGPAVDFDWEKNCFGDTIKFSNLTTGNNLVSYHWDFGDGGISNHEDTVYRYFIADTYDVSLTVTNTDGCETTIVKQIDVNDQPLAGFDTSIGTENIPVDFKGLDYTLSGDQVTSWLWDFDGQDSSIDQEAAYTFQLPNTYDINLFVITEQGCQDTISQSVMIAESQQPAVDFIISNDSACLDERVSLINNTANALSYQWDFCGGEFLNSPEISDVASISSLSQIRGFRLAEDMGNYYGFATDGSADKLWRVTFGDSLGIAAEYEEVTGLTLSSPDGIFLYHEGNSWYGLIGSSQSGYGLTLLDFGSSLQNTPTEQSLGTLGQGNIQIRDAQFYSTNDGVILLAADLSNEKLLRIRYPTSILDTPTDTIVSAPLAALTNIAGFSVVDKDNEWIGYFTSLDGANLLKVSFGNSLMNAPNIQDSYAFDSFNRPSKIRIEQSSGHYYGLVANFNGGLSLINLNDLTQTPTELSLSTPQLYSFDGRFYKGNFMFYGFNGDILTSFLFSSSCGESIPYSVLAEPEIIYNQQGEHLISLKATDKNRTSSYLVDTIVVLATQAPDISFTVDPNQCISSTNTFTSTNLSGNIINYSWDFDADGLEDSADPNPTYQFPSEGAYTVRLSVQSDEGCENFVEQEITIYPEPPIPVFTVPKDSFCVSEPVSISNLTNDIAWDGLVEYVWSATDLTDITTNSPELVFSSPGEKVISVYAQIPGCQSIEFSDTIQVVDIPIVAWTADPVCDGETVQFTNQSESGTIHWDFGDGMTSIEVAPTHLYANPGTYQASLSITNALGCTNVIAKEVVVNALPQAVFEYNILCENTEIPFQDMSTVAQSDIVAWEWYIDDVLVSQQQSPLLTFSSSGGHDVKLVVSSSEGCQAEVAESVSVSSLPAVDFTTEVGCVGEPTFFSDLTDPTSVLSRSWLIDGTSYTETNPAHVFINPGDFEVELTVTNNLLCTSIVNRTITIQQLPIPDFTIDGDCENENIVLEDISTSGGDPIASRRWSIDGITIGTGLDAIISDYSAGSHTVSLVVETVNGCVVQKDQEFEIFPQPIAAFTSSNDYGVPPFSLSFTNTSLGASVNEWYVNDQLITTNVNPELTFDAVGLKTVRLITYTSFGCTDTAEMVISADIPEVDLKITNIELLDNGQSYNIAMNVINGSNLPIETIGVNVELQNEFSIAEKVSQRINSGSQSVITLGTSVPKIGNSLAYLCISITSDYEVVDLNIADNEACIAIQPEVMSEPPFPNPATTQTNLRYILAEEGSASLYLYDMAGKLEIEKKYDNLNEGLNQFVLELGDLDAGIYVVKFHHNDRVIVSRVIKL